MSEPTLAKVRKFPDLKADSIPAVGHGGAWLVQKVEDGWVSLLSADMKCKLRMLKDSFNRHCENLENAARMDALIHAMKPVEESSTG